MDIMEELTIIELDKPFPGPIPQEGISFELWERPTVIAQYPNLRQSEIDIFNRGFKQYSYFESSTPVPIALWTFDFPKPLGMMEGNFNARVADPEQIENYLDTSEGISNAIHFFLLDGPIVKGMKISGLNPEAVKLFHATIRKQLSMDYTEAEFVKYLRALFQFSCDELFSMGKTFRHNIRP